MPAPATITFARNNVDARALEGGEGKPQRSLEKLTVVGLAQSATGGLGLRDRLGRASHWAYFDLSC